MDKKTAQKLVQAVDELEESLEMLALKNNSYILKKLTQLTTKNFALLKEKATLVADENYLPLLEALKEAIDMGDEARAKKQAEKLRALLKAKIVYRVLFLPYKASMWDSLESVWLAFKKMPNVKTTVMPISYFELDQNQIPVKTVNERDLFPQNVPTVAEQDYNLEKEHPDVIFIHNPFDAGNLVTRVLPKYYSRNLKDVCDYLAYVPYYVFVEHKTLPTLSDVLFQADGLFMSESEIKALDAEAQKYSGENEPIPLEYRVLMLNHMVASGSPKLDKARQVTRENTPLPESLKKQYQPGKITVFYNTSIQDILLNGLDQTKAVFEFFKANRDRYQLLWRPHPLLLQSLTAEEPELVAEYLHLKQDILTFGILDETPSLYPALAWSDVYYGTGGSSVTELYLVSGKPVICNSQNGIFIAEEKGDASLLAKDTLLPEEDISLPTVLKSLANGDFIPRKASTKSNSGQFIANYVLDKMKL
ncbi:hypothetical protein SAMN05216431_1158 [Ligilactobacillus sp. WC1T17]|uniref:CDP-Glycerol:Poly(Glycerophosphate) glycerophosphotransferase n=1 Tax=Ligilactobacillus ruminis TaxID=1623 RepID=A0ABY1ADU2_9LACO|nr:hypothetical protein SAMN05216431_1158 [Ligilactobacillus ruminis]